MQISKLHFLWLLTFSLIAGCGDASQAVVEGGVTLNGKPLPNAYILFQPKKGRLEEASSGQTDSAGRFTLTRVSDGALGAKVGLHQISITTIPPAAMADERASKAADLVPPQYRDGSLTFEVPVGGTGNASFALQTR